MDNVNLCLLVQLLREEQNMTWVDIAKSTGCGNAKDAALLYLKAVEARNSFKNREKVVYRKRLNIKKPVRKDISNKLNMLVEKFNA